MKTDIVLNSYIPSLFSGLKENGIDPNQFKNTPYLRKLDLLDPNKYIPNILLDDLLTSIKNELGVDSLVVDFKQHFKSTNMGYVSNYLYQSPNFLCFLENAIKYHKVLRSNYTMNLEINGVTSRFSVKINEVKGPGKLISEEIDIARILDAFMLVGGKDFQPIELGVTAKSSNILESIFPEGDYLVRLEQNESWVLFDTSLLSKPVPQLLDSLSDPESINHELVNAFKIERMLESFKSGHIPSLDELSDYLNVSRKTIERNLQNEGTHFLEIKSRFIKRKSYELLKESNLSIKEIAEQLDYANSQNFIRKFKLMNGITPNEYRHKLV
jgi:AraC-like DNA-binding protein